jgi:signal transduction histidine kinase
MIPTNFVVPSEAFGEAMYNALGEPLARARAGSRVLADQVGNAHAPAVRSLVDALEHSERALRDLVEFVRSGEMQVVRRRADLKPVCERVIDSAERRYEPTRAVELEAHAPVVGDWDTDAIAGVIARLLGVVLDEVRDGGAVGVRLQALDETVRLDVWSDGMMSAHVPWTAAPEPVRLAAGLVGGGARGLALHLASLAARAHGGRMDVTSVERKGTIFRVTLPRYATLDPR